MKEFMEIKMFTDKEELVDNCKFYPVDLLVDFVMETPNLESYMSYLANDSWSNWRYNEKHVWICLTEGAALLGVVKFRIEGEVRYEPYKYWLCYLIVNDYYRNTGLSKHLVRALFEFCNFMKFPGFVVSTYSDAGQAFLRHTIHKFSVNYPNISVVEQPEY